MYLFKQTSQTKTAGDLKIVFSVSRKDSSIPDIDDYSVLYHIEVTARKIYELHDALSFVGFEILNPNEEEIQWLDFTFIGKFMRDVQNRLNTTTDFGNYFAYLDYSHLFHGN